ncbi:MAG TPA: hypothetical protein VKP69_22830 [Isosphaeraceae bacterium]|nr:hypothetical protein [Isosphaeraceae bacterium]
MPCDQFQAVLQRDGRDHRVGAADGSADPFQFPLDPPRQLGRALVERAISWAWFGGSQPLPST